ncbi:unnamed protein product [Calypogeia fissa]
MALEASLKSFERRMREEFQLEDEGRITQLLFLKWVEEERRGLEPRELFREFNSSMVWLPARDARIIGLQKCDLFLQAAGEELRDKLEDELEVLDSDWDMDTLEWDLVEQDVVRIHERRKRRERHAEGGRTRPKKERVEAKKEVGESSSTDNLGKIAKGLKILTSHVMEERKRDVPRRK